jgi:hypothetical protein
MKGAVGNIDQSEFFFYRASVVYSDIQNLPDLPPKIKMLRLLNEKGDKNDDKCPEKHISWALIIR